MPMLTCVQASEAGVHRPHVAGIHGREDEGSYSIVLSGGYEDDVVSGGAWARAWCCDLSLGRVLRVKSTTFIYSRDVHKNQPQQ